MRNTLAIAALCLIAVSALGCGEGDPGAWNIVSVGADESSAVLDGGRAEGGRWAPGAVRLAMICQRGQTLKYAFYAPIPGQKKTMTEILISSEGRAAANLIAKTDTASGLHVLPGYDAEPFVMSGGRVDLSIYSANGSATWAFEVEGASAARDAVIRRGGCSRI